MEQKDRPDESHLVATCSAACPVHTDTREYVRRISLGDYEGALDVLLEVNPFPSVCGRICHHPCESECRRKAIDSPVSLRMLKRFVVENTGEYRARKTSKPVRTRDKKIAVIGSGPSGLTAARDLALMGYSVTVFEKDSELGGMLAHAIPKYRLPIEALNQDIDYILATGIEVRTQCEIGRDISFEELRKGFDAVLIAIGLSESGSLPIPGAGARGVYLGIPFLWDVANCQPPRLGQRVLVVGGGNVAIDIARTARRLGAGKVFMACLESRAEMPAWKWEIEEAEEEGIEIMNSWGPKLIFEDNGEATGIEFRRCTRVFDENRRFSPEYDESETTRVDVDSVILAIGQRSDLTCIEGSPVAADRGRLLSDRATLTTSVPGVYACGEVITGPGSAIQAVATGHDAAKAIESYLETGVVPDLSKKAPETIGDLPDETAALARKVARTEVCLVGADERIKDFCSIEPGYSEKEALAEARRCLACATGAVVDSPCAGCLTCLRVCPFNVPKIEKTASMTARECQTCGLCAAECPAAAISLSRFGTNRMKDTVSAILEKVDAAKISRPLVVSYCCLNETTCRKYLEKQNPEEIEQSGIVRIMVPCVGRLGAVDLLAPIELGADRVVVIACKEGGCFYTGAEELLQRRIQNVKRLLNEIGVGEGGLQYYQTQTSAEESWPRIWKEARTVSAKAASAE